jgi:lipopolysaccharide biosynthesis regulator YciM
MEFDLQWLLWGLPVAFALGWIGSRLDLRQWKRAQQDSPRAYFKGLNLLLNEQQDKAIDAFVEAVQQEPGAADLHFALGNLFRRRGEYERAVRVHEHLLRRADLKAAERERAQHALAQDFLKAGLLDRAEAAFKALDGTPFDTEARLARLGIYERTRDWRAAADIAGRLEASGTGSFASRIAHYWCEIATEADARQQTQDADEALRRARETAPQAPRPLVLEGQRHARAGRHAEAIAAWRALLPNNAAAFNLVARDHAASALQCGERDTARLTFERLYERAPSMDLLLALASLDGDAAQTQARLLRHLRGTPSLSAAQAVLEAEPPPDGEARPLLRAAVARAAAPLQRYRCAACGFEAQRYFWQCPACLAWDSYPPQRLEEM